MKYEYSAVRLHAVHAKQPKLCVHQLMGPGNPCPALQGVGCKHVLSPGPPPKKGIAWHCSASPGIFVGACQIRFLTIRIFSAYCLPQRTIPLSRSHSLIPNPIGPILSFSNHMHPTMNLWPRAHSVRFPLSHTARLKSLPLRTHPAFILARPSKWITFQSWQKYTIDSL